MPLVGNYSPAGYVAGNYATYPALPVGVTLYQPSMYWNSTGVGTMDGHAVAVGDRIYVTGSARDFGEFTYGEATYGNPDDGDWPVEKVTWLVWVASLPPDQQPPYPYTGCPFGDRNEFTPGQWFVIIEALINSSTGSRVYGTGAYGDDVYGDPAGAGVLAWADVTPPAFSATLTTGTDDGRPAVPVDTLELELVDADGTWSDIAEPYWWFQMFPGVPLRVGFFDPSWVYWPLMVGTIEQVRDDHDTRPRTVRVQAFGNDSALSVDAFGWQRPAESTAVRMDALMLEGGWRFGDGDITLPAAGATLHADVNPRDVTVRGEVDRTVMSSGWFFDTDRSGHPRVRVWPHTATGAPVTVVDCPDASTPADAHISHVIEYVADESQLLNIATISNATVPPIVVTSEESYSIARFGRKSKAMGFPYTGLAFAGVAAGNALVDRYSTRWAFIVRQVTRFGVDTRVDGSWLPTVVGMDTGRPVTVIRTVFHRFTLEGVVVGFTHRITPHRIESSVNVATTTATY